MTNTSQKPERNEFSRGAVRCGTDSGGRPIYRPIEADTTAQKIPTPNRDDYECANGTARWWVKDGAWHIAVATERPGIFVWTAEQYKTREEAIAALAKAVQS